MKVTTEVASNREKIVSALYWNKKGTKVSAKNGDKRVVFSKYPKALNKDFPPGKYLLTYSGEELQYIAPFNGTVTARFVGFVSKENEAPSPRQVEKSWDGKSYTETQAIANFRLTKPAYNGMNVSVFLVLGSGREFIVEDDDGNMTISVGKSGKAQFLVDFLEATGLIEHDFKYKANPLPKWHKVAKKAKREVTLVFKKGYVDSIIPMDDFSDVDPDVEEDDLDDFDEPEEDEEEMFDD